jgi:hypothetical protein
MVIGWCPGAWPGTGKELFVERMIGTGAWPDDYAGPGAGCDQGDLLPSSSRDLTGTGVVPQGYVIDRVPD